jgi:hypothetical protein
MSRHGSAQRYRFEAQQLRELAKGAHSQNVRHELDALAGQYEELADYVEAMAKTHSQEWPRAWNRSWS